MFQVKRILFPTDFSPCANEALDHALFLTRKYGATLHMLHAVVLHKDDPHNPAAHFADIDEIDRRLKDLARIEMKASVRERAGDWHKIVMEQRRGVSAAGVALDYARDEEIDLIVMGTHGRRGLGRLFLGSVAEAVVRYASQPVLTIRGDGRPNQPGRIRRILVPVDFSEHSGDAIRHAGEIAATYGAGLDLLHVIEETPRPGFYDAVGCGLVGIADDLEEEAVAQMHRLYSSANGSAVDVQYHAIVGNARETIIRFAEESGVGLIVIPTHGLSGLGPLLMGSVAEKVVRRAPCPVLTLKASGELLDGEVEMSPLSIERGTPGHPAPHRPCRH